MGGMIHRLKLKLLSMRRILALNSKIDSDESLRKAEMHIAKMKKYDRVTVINFKELK